MNEQEQYIFNGEEQSQVRPISDEERARAIQGRGRVEQNPYRITLEMALKHSEERARDLRIFRGEYAVSNARLRASLESMDWIDKFERLASQILKHEAHNNEMERRLEERKKNGR